jgi:hypothetical protein
LTRVSVIGTVHEEVGHANSSELLAILERIRPEVIFLEMPPSAIADYCDGPRSNLESTAVNQYRALHQVNLVPVDLPTPSAEFFSNMEEVRRSIRSRSVDYCRLVSWEEQYVEAYGFAYLNSAHYCTLIAEIHAARVAALAEIGDPRLMEIYELFTSTNERRDDAILGHIESYCIGTSFHSGVLLVGAAHRKSLSQKSAALSGPEPYPIQWDFVGSV